MKRPDADIYLVAREEAPQFSDPAYNLRTVFDSKGKAFVSVLDGYFWPPFWVGIGFFLLGAVLFVSGGFYLYFNTFLENWIESWLSEIRQSLRNLRR